MKASRLILCAAAVLLASCATVSTRIVELKPSQQFAPTQSVEVLLQKPDKPYIEIALLESRGASEAELLNDAREKAKALGADAILRQESELIQHPPVAIYDPFYDPFYFGWHRYRPLPHSPWGPYRVIGGGHSYVLKALAIKYRDGATAK